MSIRALISLLTRSYDTNYHIIQLKLVPRFLAVLTSMSIVCVTTHMWSKAYTL